MNDLPPPIIPRNIDSLKDAARTLLTGDSPSAVREAKAYLAGQYTDPPCPHCVASALSNYADDRSLPADDLEAHVKALLDTLDHVGDECRHLRVVPAEG